ncbi:MAG: Rne/Rng family ribonuclease [Elusimicrobia bacterium]|nr:Rne/Rng family ribonuclease [Elusimicrobiota bacterium]
MKKEVLGNCEPEETRVAILEDGHLAELLWERHALKGIVGNVYKGRVENVIPGISSAFVNIGYEKNAYLYITDVIRNSHNSPIDHLLKKGQEIMVQVAKEAIGTKGMKITMDLSIPGRYLVYMPFQEHVGVSKNIQEDAERDRLSSLVEKYLRSVLGSGGCIVRTEAEGAEEWELEREIKYLHRVWDSVRKKFDSLPSPCLLHQDLSLTLQVARDLLSEEIGIYLLDSKERYEEVVEFVEKLAPELLPRVKLYTAKTAIYEAFHVDPAIVAMRQSKISLPSGGTIVIQEAESLCAVDVNTGRFTGSKSQEETVTQTNLEAAQEIARQIRLRNIGGIIVIDFIDMRKASNRHRVVETLTNAVRRDRAKTRILPITRLGLVEMTRERKRESTMSLITEECPECNASGRVLSKESMLILIQREIRKLTRGKPGGSVRVLVKPAVAEVLRSHLQSFERNVHRAVRIQSDPSLNWEDYKIIIE